MTDIQITHPLITQIPSTRYCNVKVEYSSELLGCEDFSLAALHEVLEILEDSVSDTFSILFYYQDDNYFANFYDSYGDAVHWECLPGFKFLIQRVISLIY